jgi:hypothetical protein
MTGIEVGSHSAVPQFWCNLLTGPAMSVILHFPKPSMPRAASGTEARDHTAEILFFTGVRFERHADEDAKLPRPQRGGSTSGKRRRKA